MGRTHTPSPRELLDFLKDEYPVAEHMNLADTRELIMRVVVQCRLLKPMFLRHLMGVVIGKRLLEHMTGAERTMLVNAMIVALHPSLQ